MIASWTVVLKNFNGYVLIFDWLVQLTKQRIFDAWIKKQDSKKTGNSKGDFREVIFVIWIWDISNLKIDVDHSFHIAWPHCVLITLQALIETVSI